MNAICLNGKLSDEARRQELYRGGLFVYSATPASLALCQLARELANEAFHPYEPREAQHSLAVERYVEILAALKPKFIHHSRCKELIRQLFAELGCDVDKTYFDVPRLRTMTHGDYLSAGLAYPFHPHRDTWFSAPPSQLNWWIPIYDIQPDNTIAFYPKYWHTPVRNSSRDYNYYKWNKEGRREAAKQIKVETRKQPQPEEPIDSDAQIRIVCEAGGIIIFSGALLHATVPNTSGHTRFSIDFRSVNVDDVAARAGAPNIDSSCTGTTLRDYLRASDLEPIRDDIVALYDDQLPVGGELVFKPVASSY
jgi:hypothetical protein